MRLLSGVQGNRKTSFSQISGHRLFPAEGAETGIKRSALPNVPRGCQCSSVTFIGFGDFDRFRGAPIEGTSRAFNHDVLLTSSGVRIISRVFIMGIKPQHILDFRRPGPPRYPGVTFAIQGRGVVLRRVRSGSG